MNRHIICTVGTSLLTNHDDRPWKGWKHGQNQPLPDAASVVSWLRSADLARATAETNTLRALDVNEDDTLDFLHSDTAEGRFCAEALRALYAESGRCRAAFVQPLGQLGYGAAKFTTGLKSLVNVTLRRLEYAKSQKQTPVLCATGGFKAEIAFLNLLGALLEIEVVYLHEQHRQLVTLPRLPLAWNTEFAAEHEDFFTWVDAEPRASAEVESWLKGRPALRSLVEDDSDGHTLLSAAGDLLFRAAKARAGAAPPASWPDADPKLPMDKNQVATEEHHRPDGWERFVNRLCAVPFISRVRFDTAAYGGARVKVIDAEDGVLGVRFGEAGLELPLRVETTARGERQCELVVRAIKALK